MATVRKPPLLRVRHQPTGEPPVELDLGEVTAERLTAFLEALAKLLARQVVAQLGAERTPAPAVIGNPESATPTATFTIKEVAAILGIKHSHAYELARRGELPVLRLGRRLVIPRAALNQLLARALEHP